MSRGKTIYYLIIFFVVIGILGILFGPRQRDLEKIRKQNDMVPVVATSDRPANGKTGGLMYLKDEPHFLYIEKVDTEWRWFRLHYTAEYIQYFEKDAEGNVFYYTYDPDTGETAIANGHTTVSSVSGDDILDDVESIPVNNETRNETQELLLSQTYINEYMGLSFMYPDGWRVVEMSTNGPIWVVSPYESKVAGSAAYIIIENGNIDETYFSATRSDFENVLLKLRYEDIGVLSLDDISLSGHPARRLVFTASSDGVSLKQTFYLYIFDSEMYVIGCSTYENLWDEYEPVFEKIMDSYVITNTLSASSDMETNIPADSEHTKETPEEIPYGYEGEENYTDYIEWGGSYDGGWMDTTLTFSLYSDGTQDPGCGYMTTYFRGMENSGKLYYLGGNEFQWESEGYSPNSGETYYVCAIYNNGEYQLELYNGDGAYEVTFTLYEQYIP